MMIVNRVTRGHGFQCEAVVDLLASPEARADFEALVRNYSELLAIYSFMHLALKERPGGSIKPFCDPATVTSTPHSSCR